MNLYFLIYRPQYLSRSIIHLHSNKPVKKTNELIKVDGKPLAAYFVKSDPVPLFTIDRILSQAEHILGRCTGRHAISFGTRNQMVGGEDLLPFLLGEHPLGSTRGTSGLKFTSARKMLFIYIPNNAGAFTNFPVGIFIIFNYFVTPQSPWVMEWFASSWPEVIVLPSQTSG